MEDLHVGGAFSDRQAPTLNRATRNRVYEVLVAWRRCDLSQPNDPFATYLNTLATAGDPEWPRSAIRGAIATATHDFATAESIDQTTATRLQEKATEGAQFAVGQLLHFERRQAEDEVAYLMTMIPNYWEEPEVGPDFASLLVDSAQPKDRLSTARDGRVTVAPSSAI
jgi:hypothetical protein